VEMERQSPRNRHALPAVFIPQTCCSGYASTRVIRFAAAANRRHAAAAAAACTALPPLTVWFGGEQAAEQRAAGNAALRGSGARQVAVADVGGPDMRWGNRYRG